MIPPCPFINSVKRITIAFKMHPSTFFLWFVLSVEHSATRFAFGLDTNARGFFCTNLFDSNLNYRSGFFADRLDDGSLQPNNY
jgi:hypothetical protein